VEATGFHRPDHFARSSNEEGVSERVEPQDTHSSQGSQALSSNSEPRCINEWSPQQSTSRYVFKLFYNQFTAKHSSDRSACIFSSCLEMNNTRPMGLSGSTRVSTGVVINPSSAEFASSQSVSKSSGSSESGSAGLARQEGCSSGSE
jgi:hypothetical protein